MNSRILAALGGLEIVERVFTIGSKERALSLFGPRERLLKVLRDAFAVKVVSRGGEVTIEGSAADIRSAESVLDVMQNRIDEGGVLTESALREIIQMEERERNSAPSLLKMRIEGFRPGSATIPRTSGQAHYIRTMRESDVVLCIGPAGTGKTYLAVAMALHCLRTEELQRTVLCRPAVEAGERLGFLPGDMYAKVNPYLRPLYDALRDLMGHDQMKLFMEKEIIEVLPLAFVRGRTLEDSYIILDEAQNCTVSQMKTFLTRLGVSSKLVVTGDITQVDLPEHQVSGLVDARRRLKNIPGIAIVELTGRDIVRHQLVKDIVNAYERKQPRRTRKSSGRQKSPDA